MKKFLSLVMLSFMTMNASAQQEIDGIYYNLNSETLTAEVVENYDYYSGKIVIPETITFDGTTYSVTSIGEFSFYDCSSLSTVTLPSTITNIGMYAFQNCSSLKSINLPEGLTAIGEKAFGECIDLVNMQVPGTIGTMGEGVFSGCISLEDITLGDGIKTLGASAFERCDMLESITIPSSVESIDAWTFSNCISLKEIKLNEGITTIGECAFAFCYSLESLLLPESVNNIGNRAFANCESLSNITLSKNLTEIGDFIFDGCNILASIKCTGNTPAEVVNDKLLDYYKQTILYVPVGTKDTYMSNKAWSKFDECREITAETEVTDKLNKITYEGVNYVVCDFNNIARLIRYNKDEPYYGKIIIPETVSVEGNTYDVKYIGSGAFEYCNELTSITLPSSLEGIGEWAFSGCMVLARVDLPQGIKTIGAQAFYSCGSFMELTLPNSLEYIGDCAFAGCIYLSSIYSEINDPFIIFENTFDFREDQTLYVPIGTINDYKSTNYWWRFANIEEDELLTIDNAAIDYEGKDVIYDIQGRRVNNPTEGIYITKGKKIVIK